MAKYSIKQGQWGGLWHGYKSGRNVRQFIAPTEDQQALAQAWLLQQNRAEVEARWGARLAQLQFGHNRTALSVDTQDVGLAAALVSSPKRSSCRCWRCRSKRAAPSARPGSASR